MGRLLLILLIVVTIIALWKAYGPGSGYSWQRSLNRGRDQKRIAPKGPDDDVDFLWTLEKEQFKLRREQERQQSRPNAQNQPTEAATPPALPPRLRASDIPNFDSYQDSPQLADWVLSCEHETSSGNLQQHIFGIDVLDPWGRQSLIAAEQTFRQMYAPPVSVPDDVRATYTRYVGMAFITNDGGRWVAVTDNPTTPDHFGVRLPDGAITIPSLLVELALNHPDHAPWWAKAAGK